MYQTTLHIPDYTACTRLHYIYQTTQHVPDYTACTRLYSMYQTTLHIPDYTACTRLHYMYQTTKHVPDNTACTRLHSMYQTTQHVPDYTTCTRLHSIRSRSTAILTIFITASVQIIRLKRQQKAAQISLSVFFSCSGSPQWVRASSLSTLHDHTQTHHTR